MGRALIIGGSLGGLFAGLLLRQAGWEVTVFERSTGDLASRGVGIGTHVEMFDIMRRLGIVVDESIGIAFSSRFCLDRDGTVIARLPFDKILTSWTLLLPRAAAAFAGRVLPGGHAARRYRATSRRRHRNLRRRHPRRRRPAGRRRRPAFDRAGARFRRLRRRSMPAMSAGAASSTKRRCRKPRAANCSSPTPSSCRRAKCSSPICSRAPTTTSARAAAHELALVSSGECGRAAAICAPMRAAGITPPSRRR